MQEIGYNREKAVAYAHRWAFDRNPNFTNFDEMGGNCTNFASQCIYAGCGVMNYDSVNGWYYIDINNRAPAFTGVEFLYRFLVNNKSVGPYGREVGMEEVSPGDIVQLRFSGPVYQHSPVIVSVGKKIPNESNILVAANSIDSDNRPLNTYTYESVRFIKIEGARKW